MGLPGKGEKSIIINPPPGREGSFSNVSGSDGGDFVVKPGILLRLRNDNPYTLYEELNELGTMLMARLLKFVIKLVMFSVQ